MRSVSDYDQKGNTVPFDCSQLVRFVANASVARDRDPSSSTYFREPYGIRAVRRKMIGVALDGEAGGCEHFRKSFAEVAIREEDALQAARS